MMNSNNTSTSSVYVYVKTRTNKDEILAGRLAFLSERIEFRYSRAWINSSDRFSFHPELLPLSNQVFCSNALNGSLSVFRDSGPGTWGREVIKRAHPGASVADFMVLSNNLLRIGVFRFSTKIPFNTELDCVTNDTSSIDDINQSIVKLESGIPLTKAESLLVAQGSSMDGIRPKVFSSINNASWIIKFPSKNDLDNKAFNEAIGMRLAKACGIKTPEIKLIPLKNGKMAIAVKRFDIIGKKILPIMSTASLMGFTSEDGFKKDYREVAQALTRLSVNPINDCESLFKRMCINILISNRDDHIFNQALIGDIGSGIVAWQLSPVFDVVCGEGNGRGHAMQIGKMGFAGTLENALSSSESFGISQERAKEIIENLIAKVSCWQNIAKELEAEIGQPLDNECKNISWAILNNDVFKGFGAGISDAQVPSITALR
jgi:serine/threonine-protein kinase HipA